MGIDVHEAGRRVNEVRVEANKGLATFSLSL